jgi:hypothetical protein
MLFLAVEALEDLHRAGCYIWSFNTRCISNLRGGIIFTTDRSRLRSPFSLCRVFSSFGIRILVNSHFSLNRAFSIQPLQDKDVSEQ